MNNPALFSGWLAAAFGLSWLAVWAVRWRAARFGLVDHPNHRSLHEAPVARGGGAGFILAFLLLIGPAAQTMGVEIPAATWRVLIAALSVAAAGLADDRVGLPPLARLAVQSCAAVVVAAHWFVKVSASPALGSETLHFLSPFAAIFGIVAVTNFYNFMDGADGLAAGQAVLTLAAVAFIALENGDFELAVLSGLLGASVAGFLVHNWNPAAIFMGDVGSTFLGFVFGSLAAFGVFERDPPGVPLGAWLCMLSPFLADATITLARRIWRGERWYEAHRQHYYQQLVHGGWSHGRVAAAYLSVTAVLAVITVARFGFGAGTVSGVAGTCLAVIAAAFWLSRHAASQERRAINGSTASARGVLEHSLR